MLKKHPNNPTALAGLKKIERRYVYWIKNALDNGQQKRAEQFLARLRQVNPKSPQLLEFSQLIELVPNILQPLHSADIVPTEQETALPSTRITLSANQIFRDRLHDGKLGAEMVWLPAGRFRMGNIQGGGDDDEYPVHQVYINRFAMSRYEVTFSEYDHFADATDRDKPLDEGWGRGNRPVINVSIEDAKAYADWLSSQTGKEYRSRRSGNMQLALKLKLHRVMIPIWSVIMLMFGTKALKKNTLLGIGQFIIVLMATQILLP